MVYPRQCVFAGTTNRDVYLHDETGNRRFWPVKVVRIDLDGFARDRDQLWAEAVHFYRAGECWWLQDDGLIATATDEQAGRHEGDPWEEKIAGYLAQRDKVTVSEILVHCLELPPSMQRKGEQMRVTSIVKNLGWQKGPKVGSKRFWIRTTSNKRPRCSDLAPTSFD